MKALGVEIYAGRIQEHKDKTPRQSEFSFGLYGQRWIYGMELWADLAQKLIALKPHNNTPDSFPGGLEKKGIHRIGCRYRQILSAPMDNLKGILAGLLETVGHIANPNRSFC